LRYNPAKKLGKGRQPKSLIVPTYPLGFSILALENRDMFLRAKKRFEDGKEHRYWSTVENRRMPNKRVVQRQVLYLGEINDSQHDSGVGIQVC